MSEERVCKACSGAYLVKDIHANFGSDHNKKCWPCLKKWVEEAAADPYRVGAGFMRNEPPHIVSDYIVETYKGAFELTKHMLKKTHNG